MIEKMKYINLMGPSTAFDRITERILSRYEIQLEYTMKELSDGGRLVPFAEANPYPAMLRKAEPLLKLTGLSVEDGAADITYEDAARVIDAAAAYYENVSEERNKMLARQEGLRDAVQRLAPFIQLDFRVEDFSRFRFIQYRFGRMPVSSFMQFEAFLYRDAEILFVQGKDDGDYLWGVYFVPESLVDKVDSMFASLRFERIMLPTEIDGEPLRGDIAAVHEGLQKQLASLSENLETHALSLMAEADRSAEIPFTRLELASACYKLQSLSRCFDIRRYAARTENDFFILVGWMSAKQAALLETDLSGDSEAVLIVEDQNASILSRPPTKLRNPWFTRPFEFFVRMYGLPSYDELDPTPFVALTYTILFGVMFADVGQGALVSLLGLVLWKTKKLALGSIMGVIGLSSMLFGVLFGSVFGNEETIPALWMHPAESANITNTLIYAIVFGVVLILISMSFHIANAARKRKLLQAVFSPSGVAGLVFYVAVLASVALVFLGYGMIAGWLIALFLVLPLLLMMLREPILNAMQRKRKLIHGGVALFLFEAVIEMFEVLLGYFSNTVSFMRVGAFVLAHASIMGVVWMMSRSASGSHNIVVIILGNLLVIGLEGLIAGIQVLRLQFYEMFSRFYEGGGRAFTPFQGITRD